MTDGFQSDAVSCFVISSFEEKMVDVLDNIGFAVSVLGYKCERADSRFHGREITGEIHDRIRKAAFVVADLSIPSPNVFYEVGFARGIGKRVILICADDPAKEFDLRNVQQIVYKNLRDLRTQLQEAVKQQIGEAEKLSPQATPTVVISGKGQSNYSLNDFLVLYTTQIEQATDRVQKATAYLNRARVYSSLRLVEQAVEDLQSARELNPDDTQIYVDLGYVFNQVKRFDEALKMLDTALNMDPALVKAHVHRAYALNGLERYDDAIEAASRALSYDRNNSVAKKALQYAQNSRLGSVIEEVELQSVAETVEPTEESVLLASQTYAQRGQYTLALGVLDGAINSNLISGNIECARGEVLRLLYRYDEALTAFRRAIELEPNDWRNYYELGATLLTLKRFLDSVPYFQQALSREPKDDDAIVQMGYALARNGKVDLALQAYNLVLSQNPQNVRALLNRGYLYNDLNRRFDALADYETATQLDPFSVEGWVQRAYTLAGLNRLKEAEESVRHGLEIQPDNRAATKVLTDIYRRMQGQLRT